MFARLMTVFLVLLVAAPALSPAAVATTSFSAADEGPNPKAVQIAEAKDGHLITIKLTGLAKGTKIRRARLRAARGPVAKPEDLVAAIEIYPGEKPGGKPLALVGPWYDAFDATAAVARAVGAGAGELKLFVKAFPAWRQETTRLEVVHDGRPIEVTPAATGLRAFHRAGQTFITWKEVDPLVTAKKATWGEYKEALAKGADACSYRIYAHSRRIDAKNFLKAEFLAEVGPLSCWNVNGRNMEYLIGEAMKKSDKIGELAENTGHRMYTWGPDSKRMDRYPLDRLVIDEKAGPLAPGTGLYVHHPKKAGKRYYAVVSCRAGVANLSDFAAGNRLAKPVAETVGPGVPVRQGKGLWGPFFDYHGTRWVYVQWAGPPLYPLPSAYFNWSVLIPPDLKAGRKVPCELYLHRGGNWSYAKPRMKLMRGNIQIAPHDYPASGWYGYNDAFGTLKSYAKGTVSNHTHKRIIAFVDWAGGQFPLDPDRVILPGSDGAVMLAMNYRDRFAYVLVASFGRGGKVGGRVLDPKAEPYFAAIWGPRRGDIKDEFGRVNWGWAMLDKLARERPGDDIPLICCRGTSWGGVYKYGKAFGPFYTAMQEVGQPVIAGHGWNKGLLTPDRFTGLWGVNHYRPGVGLAISRRTPIPAYANSSRTRESLQDGNTNWEHPWRDVSDQPERFQITLGGSGKVDVTPRRLQQFKVKPGRKLRYETKPIPTRRDREKPQPQSGTITVDANGLFTIKQVVIPAGGVVVTVTRVK